MRISQSMELLLYSGVGGLRNSAEQGSLLENSRLYAAKMRGASFARARAAASAGAPDSVCATARWVQGPALDEPPNFLTEAASRTPSRAHVPSVYARREPPDVCAALSPSKAHVPHSAAFGAEEEAESCALPALRTWDEGDATLDAMSRKGTLKAPCTPPKPVEAQQDNSDSTDGREPVEDLPARLSVGSWWQGMETNTDAMHGLIDEGTKIFAGDEHDDKENMLAAPSWFCNVKTPSTEIVLPVYPDFFVPANNLRRGFQTDPLGQNKCNELSRFHSARLNAMNCLPGLS